jgi:hypothetical protein
LALSVIASRRRNQTSVARGRWIERAASVSAEHDSNPHHHAERRSIELETKLIQPNNERTVKDTYVLDGKEYDFTPLVPPNQPPARQTNAMWLPATGHSGD